jgi:C4-dicarboxylate transporter DctQ subunit
MVKNQNLDSPLSPEGLWLDKLEENLIAIFLGLMTLITFANVIARYVFNDNLLWALQTTVFLFAWMVLLGAAYCVKKSLHLGVDILVERLPKAAQKPLALISVLACLAFSILLLKGSWDYWYPFATSRAFLEVDDIPMPDIFQFLSVLMNEGEAYEKIPRFIPYSVLPIAMALMTWRFLEAGWKICRGDMSSIIASHGTENEKPID